MSSKKKKNKKSENGNISGGADVGMYAMFIPKQGDPDTVIVKFTFTDNVDADSKNNIIHMAKDVIKHYTRKRGWDTWLKMEVEIETHEE